MLAGEYMSIDVKRILGTALLELTQKKPLESLTVSQILKETGVSRQTFYNHFKDKNDLICYVYDTFIVPEKSAPVPQLSTTTSSVITRLANFLIELANA